MRVNLHGRIRTNEGDDRLGGQKRRVQKGRELCQKGELLLLVLDDGDAGLSEHGGIILTGPGLSLRLGSKLQ